MNCTFYRVDDKKVVKIADFGLARDIFDKGYYKPDESKPLPYRWMAIECLAVGQQRFTTKSDVVSTAPCQCMAIV